jgi:hypothetical protein
MTAAQAPASDKRIIRVGDGEYAEVTERRLLPPSLDLLLAHLRVTVRYPFRLVGTVRECTELTHAFGLWLDGTWGTFELRLNRCPFCGTVEVRDISLDYIPGISSGRLDLRRRSDVLGWYSGRRPAGRVHI